MPLHEDLRTPQQILNDIREEFERASHAERAFVDWERTNKTATCDEFAEHFNRWVDSSLPYVRSRHLIEEHFPEYNDAMQQRLSG